MAQEHAYEPWDERAYRALFEGLFEGLSDAELTARLGRSASSLSSTSSKLLAAVLTLDPEADVPGKGLDSLRMLVSRESEQDWIPLAREAHKNTGKMFWGANEDDQLTRAWESQGGTISTIASQLGTGDAVVLTRLVWLGLARDRDEAIERLGVDPGSLFDVRQRLADGTAIEQWVLTVSDPKGRILHVSIHANETGARGCIERETERAMKRDELVVARWTLACRVMGWDNEETFETDLAFLLSDNA
ncbi:hypothetical protein [Microbacterium lacticum]